MKFVGLIQKPAEKKTDAKPRKNPKGSAKAESGDDSGK